MDLWALGLVVVIVVTSMVAAFLPDKLETRQPGSELAAGDDVALYPRRERC